VPHIRNLSAEMHFLVHNNIQALSSDVYGYSGWIILRS
jgi:hypothetical protein